MKRFVMKRNGGYAAGFRFDNGTSAAISTKTFKSRKGADACCERVVTLCGDTFGRNGVPGSDFPWETLTKDGIIQRNFTRISCANV